MAKFIYTGKMKEEIETRMIEDPDAAIEVAAESYQKGYEQGAHKGVLCGCLTTVLSLIACKWVSDHPDKIKAAAKAVGDKTKGAINSITSRIKSHSTEEEDEEA